MATVPVLYCIDSLPVSGGTEGQLAGILARLDRSRFSPYLCTLRPDVALRDIPADCPHLPLNVPRVLGPGAWGQGVRLAQFLRRHQIKVVQTFFQDATIFGIWTARQVGVPVRLISFRDLGFWRTTKLQFMMRRTYPLATGFVANSIAVRDHFVAQDNLAAGRFHVITNGVDADDIADLPLAPSPPRVVLVGNLNRHVKRPDLFIRAAALARDLCPEAQWQLIGDGHLRGQLENLVSELDLSDSVSFLGRRSDVAACLQGAAIGVNCSDSEGFSNAVLEYMLAGCTVVATAVGGNSELVRDGVDGRLVPANDAEALAAAVVELCRDPVRARTMATAARRKVEAEFGWERCMSQLHALYTESIERRPRGRHLA